jgi:hypothetical protein
MGELIVDPVYSGLRGGTPASSIAVEEPKAPRAAVFSMNGIAAIVFVLFHYLLYHNTSNQDTYIMKFIMDTRSYMSTIYPFIMEYIKIFYPFIMWYSVFTLLSVLNKVLVLISKTFFFILGVYHLLQLILIVMPFSPQLIREHLKDWLLQMIFPWFEEGLKWLIQRIGLPMTFWS